MLREMREMLAVAGLWQRTRQRAARTKGSTSVPIHAWPAPTMIDGLGCPTHKHAASRAAQRCAQHALLLPPTRGRVTGRRDGARAAACGGVARTQPGARCVLRLPWPCRSTLTPAAHAQLAAAVVRGFNAGSLLNAYATVASGLGALVRLLRTRASQQSPC
jgi:hypothetical protein